jgi:hypothetical protein
MKKLRLRKRQRLRLSNGEKIIGINIKKFILGKMFSLASALAFASALASSSA